MSLVSLSLAILVAVVGLALFAFFSWCLIRPLMGSTGEFFALRKMRRAGEFLDGADRQIAQRAFREALPQLRHAVVLSPGSSPAAISLFREHHQNVLSRCILIADRLQVKLDNLARVEHLLMERADLLALLSKANSAFENLSSRRKEAGKAVAQWSREDYHRRLKDIRSELDKNARLLSREFESLFSAFDRSSGDEITYH